MRRSARLREARAAGTGSARYQAAKDALPTDRLGVRVDRLEPGERREPVSGVDDLVELAEHRRAVRVVGSGAPERGVTRAQVRQRQRRRRLLDTGAQRVVDGSKQLVEVSGQR